MAEGHIKTKFINILIINMILIIIVNNFFKNVLLAGHFCSFLFIINFYNRILVYVYYPLNFGEFIRPYIYIYNRLHHFFSGGNKTRTNGERIENKRYLMRTKWEQNRNKPWTKWEQTIQFENKTGTNREQNRNCCINITVKH